MEKIRINAINKKPCASGGEIVIVKYSLPTAPGIFAEATLNTKWQAQEVDYLEKDVGVGGECSVLIVQKGDYTNITKVDMKSAVKGNSVPQEQVQTQTPIPSMAFDRNASIIAQCLTKIEYRNSPQPNQADILESYRWYLKELG